MTPAISNAADFSAFSHEARNFDPGSALPALALLLKLDQAPGFHPGLPRFQLDSNWRSFISHRSVAMLVVVVVLMPDGARTGIWSDQYSMCHPTWIRPCCSIGKRGAAVDGEFMHY